MFPNCIYPKDQEGRKSAVDLHLPVPLAPSIHSVPFILVTPCIASMPFSLLFPSDAPNIANIVYIRLLCIPILAPINPSYTSLLDARQASTKSV